MIRLACQRHRYAVWTLVGWSADPWALTGRPCGGPGRGQAGRVGARNSSQMREIFISEVSRFVLHPSLTNNIEIEDLL